MKKVLEYSGENYGVIGKKTGVRARGKDVHIGDYVVYYDNTCSFSPNNVIHGVVVEEPNGKMSIFGYCGTSITGDSIIKIVDVIIPFDLMTKEFLQNRSKNFSIKQAREFTLSEIETLLGYPITIITEAERESDF